MATQLRIKRGTTNANAPSGLTAGEMAINLVDKKLYVGGTAGTNTIFLDSTAVAGLSTANTFTQLNTFSAGISASGATFTGSISGATATFSKDITVTGTITGKSVTGMFGQYAYSAAAYNYDGSSVIPRYGSPHINANTAGGNMGTDTVYFNLIHISKAVTINKILAYCGTGGGGTGDVRYGIYSVSSTGYPDQRLYGSGSIAFTGVATTQISVTGVATQLDAGWYFLAAIFSDVAGAKAYALSTIGFHAFGQTNAVMTSGSRAMYYDDTVDLAYGFTLQTSYPTANMYVEKGVSTVRIPALYFEIA